MFKAMVVLKYTIQLLLSQKVTYWPVITGFFLALVSLFLGGLSIVEQDRMMVHLGLGLSHLVVLIYALVVGVQFLFQQIESREIEIILSHPLTRASYFLGTWMGHLTVILCFQLFIFVFWTFLTGFKFANTALLMLFSTSTVESFFVFTLAYAAASLLRPFLAASLTITVWLGSYWKEDLQFMANKTKDKTGIFIGQVMEWVFPPLNQINVRSIYFLTEQHQINLPLGLPTLTILLWVAVLISGALIVFDRRDLG